MTEYPADNDEGFALDPSTMYGRLLAVVWSKYLCPSTCGACKTSRHLLGFWPHGIAATL
eukprot:m.7230 g.7230  ORF g.7230 m.7230 type:complete len:59 (+) comp6588_c0_seq2:95-271(+)